jgi:DNA-binding PadR family transcriptional regulator
VKLLSRQEEIVLLAIWQLGDNAYGVTIREYIGKVTGKYWSIGSIYVPLDRLTEKGFIKPYQGEAIEKRGGRSKRMFELTSEGMQALEEIRRVQDTLWKGFPRLAVDRNK